MIFADAGLTAGEISTLFLVWSSVGIVAEVPCGALADRFSRRKALAAAGVLQSLGYVLWVAAPEYRGFAAGFVVWALGGALRSGALEALLHDGLAAAGAGAHYPRVYGRISAVGLLSQVPSAAAATVLFSTGGAALVGWASVACCLLASFTATRLPEGGPEARQSLEGAAAASGAGYLTTLRSGLREAARRPPVRAALLALAVLGGVDGLEEYFPLLAQGRGVPTSMVPLAVLGIPLVGAAGAACGGRASRLHPRTLAILLGGAVASSAAAALVHRPAGLLGIALAYGLYQLVLVVTDARLQERIEGSARATVTSVAAVGAEVGAAALYVLWALELPVLIAAVVLAAAAALPRLLADGRRDRVERPARDRAGRRR